MDYLEGKQQTTSGASPSKMLYRLKWQGQSVGIPSTSGSQILPLHADNEAVEFNAFPAEFLSCFGPMPPFHAPSLLFWNENVCSVAIIYVDIM
jgi:hypothetical protein